MTTNQAFMKAYRQDAPRAAAAAPSRARTAVAPAAIPAGWQTSVEIVTADYGFEIPAIAAATNAAPASQTMPQRFDSQLSPPRTPAFEPTIGKRPLSAFTAPQAIEPQRHDVSFTPETTIGSFRWPRTCRALWDQFADQYERVADVIQSKCYEHRTLIGIAGLHPSDGCSTTLLCLAMALATRGQRVAIVDANFMLPRLADLLGIEPTTAWQDVLEHGVPIAEAMIHATNDNVDLLPLDSYSPEGPRRASPQLAAGLQTSITAGVLRHAYDVVLIDLGAMLAPGAFDTVSQLARNMRIDGAVVVTDPRQSQTGDLEVAGELLEEEGCEFLGVIENRG